MQKQGRRTPPPLVFIKYRVTMASTQRVSRLAAHTPQDFKTAASRFVSERHPTDSEHQKICDQERRGHGSFLLAKESGKFLAQGSERKSQARSALVAARGVDSDQRIARRADFRPRLLVAPAKKCAHRAATSAERACDFLSLP